MSKRTIIKFHLIHP